MSKTLGFSSFQVKKTSRFLKNLYEDDLALDSTILDYGKHPIYDSSGRLTGVLELPVNKEYRNVAEKDAFDIIEKYGSLQHFFDLTPVECKAQKTHGIFISAAGEVFPCCTVYQQVCYVKMYGVQDCAEANEYNIYKKHQVSAITQSIESIVNGGFFKQLQDGWELPSIKDGKPKSCARTCGGCFDMHSGQHK